LQGLLATVRAIIPHGIRILFHSSPLPPTALKERVRKNPFINTPNVSAVVREVMRRAGFKERPYVLRNYFDSRLLVAELERQMVRGYETDAQRAIFSAGAEAVNSVDVSVGPFMGSIGINHQHRHVERSFQ